MSPFSAALASVPTRGVTSLAVRQDGDVPSTAEQAMFNRAQALFNQKRFEQSASLLREFLQTYPKSFITDLTLLWLGRSYIELNRLPDAEKILAQLREMEDTPFLDVYQNELGDARRKFAAAPQTKASSPVEIASSANPATVNPPRPTASPVSSLVARRIDSTSRANVAPASSPVTRNTNSLNGTPNGTSNATVTSTRTNPPRVTPTPAPTPSATPAPTPEQAFVAATPSVGNNANSNSTSGFSVTVKQIPNLLLALRTPAITASPNQVVAVPLVVTNTGNKEDQFRLETDLPAEYQPTFSLATQGSTDTGLPILVTPQIPRNGNMDVVLNLRIPETAADNQQRRFLVRAASQSDFQVTKIADAALTVTAAALTAATSVSQPSVLPGETFEQTISIRNNGSAASRSTRADFVFDPDFELVSANPAPLVYDRPSRTAIWDLREMGARDSRDITVRLRAVGDALAVSKALGRGTLRTSSLPVPSNFDGPNISVGRVTKAQIDSISSGLTATPGDTFYVPFMIRNPSNYPEAFELRLTAPGAPVATAYADTNGDGQHQDGEPIITRTNDIEPRGGQFPILLRVDIPRSTPDGQQYAYNVVARSLSNSAVANEGTTVLKVAAPRVRVRTEQVTTEVAPGETIYYRLVLVNDGAGLAKNLVVNEQLPDAVQFVNSEPDMKPLDSPDGVQRLQWRVSELAPGDTTVLRIAVRLKPNLNANASFTNRTNLVYQDSNSNNYQGQ